MNKIQLGVDDISSTPLAIGFEGEQNHTQIVIYWTALYEQYPNAAATMVMRPPVGDAYPRVIQQDENKIIWDVSASDTATAGSGAYQLTFTDSDEIIKTYIGQYTVMPSLSGSGEEPTPVTDWVNAANEVLAAVEQYTESIESKAPKANPVFTGEVKLGSSASLGRAAGSVVGSNSAVFGTNSRATQTASFAQGSSNYATGQSSHAEGTETHAEGYASHAEGRQTYARSFAQHVAGTYNVKDTETTSYTKGTYAEIIGNGTADNARSNARALDWNGNERLKGDLYIHCNADSTGGKKVAAEVDVQTVTGATPTIIGVDNTRYMCGEVDTISITPPESGIIDVVFSCGSIPAVLTIPDTVKFPEWFDSTTLEADRTYEINILDGVYGLVTSWGN